VQATPEESAWLHDFLSFEDNSSQFVRRRDGSIKRVEPRKASLLTLTDTFPAGLTTSVRKNAIKDNFLVNVVDKRTPPCVPMTWQQATGSDDVWLYDFQREAVEEALTRTRGILDVPTGGGKTEIATGIALRLGMTNTLFIAPETDLMHNAARRWEKRVPNVPAGRIGDGLFDPRDGFTSATFQTLASRLAKNDKALRAYLQTVGCMIVDEVHTLPADTFYNVAQAVPAYWRIGVSGTPLARGDRRSLFSIAATGSIIYKVPTKLLIERGFISRPHIRMVPHVQAGDASGWQQAEKINIINSKSRNQLVTHLAANAPGPALVFVRMKQHGLELTKMIAATGKRVEFVWGEKATHQRDASIEKLRNGDLDIIVCSVVFQTGTDIPEVKSMVIACGGKSEIAALQRIGRGMRIVRGANGEVLKDEFYVFDIFDREPQSQSGETANRWAAEHSQERFKAYTAVGHEVTIAT
jgi:superfamily II DNA or RNA helicase